MEYPSGEVEDSVGIWNNQQLTVESKRGDIPPLESKKKAVSVVVRHEDWPGI